MINLGITEEDRKGTLFMGKPIIDYPQEDLLDIALYIAKSFFHERKEHHKRMDFMFSLNKTRRKLL